MKTVLGILVFMLFLLNGPAEPQERKDAGGTNESDIVTSAALDAPKNLRLKIVSGGFELSWGPAKKDNAHITGYEIVRASMVSGPYERVATVGKGVYQYVDTSAHPEVINYYKVRAVAGKKYSPFSNTVAGERPPNR